MRALTIDRFLDDLASAAPAPGGGAVAGLQVAFGAALIAMVCELTVGRERYRDHEEELRAALAAATALRERAAGLAEEDAEAYGRVAEAFGLPKGSEQERGRRAEVLGRALERATAVPLATVEAGAEALRLCARILPGVNRTVLSDVGVAAHCARAGMESAALNVRINLGLISEGAFAGETRATLEDALAGGRATADEVVREVERSL